MTLYCGTNGGLGPLPSDPDSNQVLTVTPAFGGVDVSWTYPEINPQAVAYTIVYRSTSADPATKVNHHNVSGDYFYDRVDPEKSIEYYYWIQWVSINGTYGELIGPASATARPTIEQMLYLLSGQISQSSLAQSLREELYKINTVRSSLDKEIEDRISNYSALVDDYARYQESVDGLASFIGKAITRLEDDDTRMISEINALGVKTTENEAMLVEESVIRANRDEAIAEQVNILKSETNSTLAAIIRDYETSADAQSARASLQEDVLVEMDKQVSGVRQSIDVVADDVGNIKTEYTTKIQFDKNGTPYVGGFGLMGDSSSGLIQAGFDVDRFWVGKQDAYGNFEGGTVPFVINGSEVFISEAAIQSLTINKLRAADNSLAFSNGKLRAHLIDVDNLTVMNAESRYFRSGSHGWRLDELGNAELNNAQFRGTIEGSNITGSSIRGSTVIGTAFVTPTDAGEPYLAQTTNMSWGHTDNWTYNSRYSPYVDIYSYNYYDTDEYRRSRSRYVDIDVSMEGVYSDSIMRFVVLLGTTRLVDTGNKYTKDAIYKPGGFDWGDYSAISGPYYDGDCGYTTTERCSTHICSGGTTCSTVRHGSKMTLRIRNVPYYGHSRLRFKYYIKPNNSHYWSVEGSEVNITMNVINDY